VGRNWERLRTGGKALELSGSKAVLRTPSEKRSRPPISVVFDWAGLRQVSSHEHAEYRRGSCGRSVSAQLLSGAKIVRVRVQKEGGDPDPHKT